MGFNPRNIRLGQHLKINEIHRINGLKRKTTVSFQKIQKKHLTKLIIYLWKSRQSRNGRKLPQPDKGHLQKMLN